MAASRRRPHRDAIAAGADTLVAGTVGVRRPRLRRRHRGAAWRGARHERAAARAAGCAMRAGRIARLPSLRMGRVPDAPALPVRDPWPGDPGRGARLLRGELEIGGGVRALQPGGWGDASRLFRAATPPRTASPGCATCARWAPTPPGCAPAPWSPSGSPRRLATRSPTVPTSSARASPPGSAITTSSPPPPTMRSASG